MRDILFKAKRLDNGEWVEGYLIQTTSVVLKSFIVTSASYTFGKWNWADWVEVDTDTICQYTGLTAYWTAFENEPQEWDVWEHDLLEVDYEGKKVIANVKYEGGMYILASNEFIDSYIPLFDVVHIEEDYWIDAEHIGNIFDNPELLGV